MYWSAEVAAFEWELFCVHTELHLLAAFLQFGVCFVEGCKLMIDLSLFPYIDLWAETFFY